MNKQALAFLTMFSLILMLSVYYVTLPADSTSVMEEQAPQSDKKADKENTAAKTEDAQGKTEEAQEQKKDTSESADGSTKLQDSINQKKEEEINRNSSVVADTKSDDSAKKEALAAIDELKDEKSMQKSVADLLKKDGYQTAVEINGDTCIISVFEQKDDKKCCENDHAEGTGSYKSQIFDGSYFQIRNLFGIISLEGDENGSRVYCIKGTKQCRCNRTQQICIPDDCENRCRRG